MMTKYADIEIIEIESFGFYLILVYKMSVVHDIKFKYVFSTAKNIDMILAIILCTINA